MSTLVEQIVREAQRVEEDSLYSAKGHFVAARGWRSFHFIIGVPTAILAAVAGASALSQMSNGGIVAGVLAIIVTALTAVSTFLNPNEKAAAHLNAGNRYNSLRNRARIFREIEVSSGEPEGALLKRLNEMAAQRDELNQNSPPIPRWAFRGARSSIAKGEATYQVDHAPLGGD